MNTDPHRFLKANVLSFFILGSAFLIGFVGGTWLIPVLVMHLGSHDISFGDFPRQVGVFPLVPEVIDPKKDRNQFLFLEYGNMFAGIAGVVVLGWVGLRLNHYLIVKKFKWLSQEEAMRTEKHQWM